MLQKVVTLDEFIFSTQGDFNYATGELSGLLRDIGFASKIIHRSVNKAGLVDILGAAGQDNVQGEQQKKLDIFANDQFINALRCSGQCAGTVSYTHLTLPTTPYV